MARATFERALECKRLNGTCESTRKTEPVGACAAGLDCLAWDWDEWTGATRWFAFWSRYTSSGLCATAIGGMKAPSSLEGSCRRGQCAQEQSDHIQCRCVLGSQANLTTTTSCTCQSSKVVIPVQRRALAGACREAARREARFEAVVDGATTRPGSARPSVPGYSISCLERDVLHGVLLRL